MSRVFPSTMPKGRSIIPDLDALESPVLSPATLNGYGGVPGSAIAEKIFNDPDSWDTSGDETDYSESDTLLWVADEIQKLRRLSTVVAKDNNQMSRGDKRAHHQIESSSRKNTKPLASGSTSPRNRPLPIATPSPPPNSTLETTSANSPPRIRRLPSIPSESQPSSTPCSNQDSPIPTTPPRPSGLSTPSTIISSSKSSAMLSPFFPLGSVSQLPMGLRTPSTARSPLGVPLGPRTRSRSTDANGQPMQTIQPC